MKRRYLFFLTALLLLVLCLLVGCAEDNTEPMTLSCRVIAVMDRELLLAADADNLDLAMNTLARIGGEDKLIGKADAQEAAIILKAAIVILTLCHWRKRHIEAGVAAQCKGHEPLIPVIDTVFYPQRIAGETVSYAQLKAEGVA